MDKLTHILNGDGTAHPFIDSGVAGDIIVWREMLMEGPVTYRVNTPVFNKFRSDFVKADYEAAEGDYAEKVVGEFDKVAALPDGGEVVLWFEHDLFCQINMVAALCYIKNLNKQLKVSLVSINDHPTIASFKGMGQLSPEHFPELFENRKELALSDLAFADKLWMAYCNSDPEQLFNMSQGYVPNAFPYLKEALAYHFRRFPDQGDGLNRIQKELLEKIQNGQHAERRLIGDMLKSDYHYGFGDMQVSFWLQTIDSLIDRNEDQLSLNEVGKSVLAGEDSFTPNEKKPIWVGGAGFDMYYWNEIDQQIIYADNE